MKSLVARSRGGEAALSDSDRVRLATLTTEDYLGRGDTTPSARSIATEAQGDGKKIDVDVEVVWGDVTKVAAQLYSVGHYRGVVPQRAELALDDAISKQPGRVARNADGTTGGIIAAQTRRNGIRADVGDISYFPWADAEHPGRVVAVAGMGSPGTFDASDLRRLVKSAAIAASELSEVDRWCSVLIGSGEGTLTTEDAVAAWVRGLDDAAEAVAARGGTLPTLVIVEMIKGRAERTAKAFQDEATRVSADADANIVLTSSQQAIPRAGRRLGDEDANELLLTTLARGAQADAPKALRDAWRTIQQSMGVTAALRNEVIHYVTESAKPKSQGRGRSVIPSRISFLDGGGVMRVAAIDETATVPERLVTVDQGLLDELVVRMTDASAAKAHALGGTLFRLAVPADFHPVLSAAGPFVLELDRTTAGQHWEMCRDDDRDEDPLGVRAEVARQLRTTYSPAPARRTGGNRSPQGARHRRSRRSGEGPRASPARSRRRWPCARSSSRAASRSTPASARHR